MFSSHTVTQSVIYHCIQVQYIHMKYIYDMCLNQPSDSNKLSMTLHWNTMETLLKFLETLSWDTLNTFWRNWNLLLNQLEALFKYRRNFHHPTPANHSSNYLKTHLKHSWHFLEAILKLPLNFHKILMKLPGKLIKIFLKHPLKCCEIPVKQS